MYKIDDDHLGLNFLMLTNLQKGRERAKERRRQDIINAAEDLVKEYGSTEFTMNDLAKRAGITPYTTYNLIGNKSSVIFRLLNICISRLDNSFLDHKNYDNPIEKIFCSVNFTIDNFINNDELYKPLMRYVFGIFDPINRPVAMKMGLTHWSRVAQPLTNRIPKKSMIKEADVSQSILSLFNGCLEFWVNGFFNAEEFRIQANRGISMIFLSLDFPEFREYLVDIFINGGIKIKNNHD